MLEGGAETSVGQCFIQNFSLGDDKHGNRILLGRELKQPTNVYTYACIHE